MRRRLAAIAVAALLLPACGGVDRPEGVVERWLVSLNAGAAGRPDRYADDAVSEQILPGFEDADPGELDVIEVGKGSRNCPAFGRCPTIAFEVPFRIALVSGDELRKVALVEEENFGELRVVSMDRPPPPPGALPSEGGPAIASLGLVAWLAAIGAAAVFILVATGLMALAKPRLP